MALSQLGLECFALNLTKSPQWTPQTSISKTINSAELAGIVAALINVHTHIATDSAGAVWQTRRKKHPLPPAHEMALTCQTPSRNHCTPHPAT